MADASGARERPLAGKKIVVTRARPQAGGLAAALEELGAEIIEFPTIQISYYMATGAGHDNRLPLGTFDWIVFTSANAVTYFLRRLDQTGQRADEARRARICAVGPATARTLAEHGLSADVVPATYVAESVVDAINEEAPSLQDKNVLIPMGNIARDVVPSELRRLGANVQELTVYRTEKPPVADEKIQTLVDARPDLVTFTSASTARNFCEILGAERLDELKRSCAFASIGPMTTKAAEAHGLTIRAEPEDHDVPGLVDAIVQWAEGE